MSSVTARLAERVLGTRWEDLPPEVGDAAKSVLFDAVPVMAAGAKEDAARIVRRFVASMGGEPRCSVIGGGFSTSPPMAALANGVAGHVLDYEPMWHPPTHPTSPVLPVALALAEWQGRDGRDVLTALVAGFEVQTRLLLAAQGGGGLHLPGGAAGLHPPGVVGVMGAAAAASWLLGLGTRETCMAFGIAASRAGGLMANVGTMTKSSHCGHAGRMGLESALLAAAGFTADEDIFDAPRGYGEVFLGWDGEAPDLASGFGQPFRIHDPGVAIKKYPSQYGTQRAIDAALAIARAHDLRADDITSVTVVGPRMDYVDRPRPVSGLDGKFSFQYVTAVALLDGRVGIDSFADTRRWADDVEALLPKITYVPQPDIPPNFDQMWIRTTMKLNDGRELSAECRKPTGLWGIPLKAEECEFKARDCLARAVADGDAARIMDTLHGFDTCSASDVRELLAALCG